MLPKLLLAPAFAGLIGAVVWAVARYGLSTADQTSSVVGGVIGLITLPLSFYGLRDTGTGAGQTPSPAGTDARRGWVAAAAVHPSLRPPVLSAPVRGRDEELAEVRRRHRGRDGGMVVICGAGGLGKTTLAAQAAQQAQQDGHAVFWIRWQDNPEQLAADLTTIAQTLGLNDQQLSDAQTERAVLVDTVWDHLTRAPGWVIVVDNVDTPNRIGPTNDPVADYRGWLRPDGAGLLLITSRDTTTDTWGPHTQITNLNPLQEEAAGQVLHDAAPLAGNREDARALASRLGGLPLALQAAGRYLATPTSRYTAFTTYQAALENEFGDLVAAAHPRADDPAIARTVVRHTWHISLDQLHNDGYTLARPLIHLLALLEPAPIPRALITPTLLTDATGRPTTATALDTALAGLHQYGLITTPNPETRNPTVEASQLALHPLVREVMALPTPGINTAACLTAVDAHLVQTVDDTAQAGRAGCAVAHLLAPHLAAALDRATTNDFTITRDAVHTLACALSDVGFASDVHLLVRHMLDAETRHLPPDDPEILDSRHFLANTLSSLGRYREAADLHQHTLADRERTLGP
ncbi:tetratricopeptide repeat protein, partial [Streptomyces sp. NPDC005209]|uniref:tetratricopeptide repeat protein n=1 Tax=Streptomyces sp. NPDC005209 TaxID=3156715 RepID=UPI0033BEBF50